MTRNGSPVPVALEPVANGYGENTLVWVTDNINVSSPYTPSPPVSDTVNAVTINNVMIGGTSHTFNYQVIVFDPAQGGTPRRTACGHQRACPLVSCIRHA